MGEEPKKYARAWHCDERGVWRDQQITWHGGGGPRYEILHPVTKLPCKVPDEGWRFVENSMKEKIAGGWIAFRKDHTEPPFLKQYVYLENDSGLDDEAEAADKEVLGSVFYRHSQPAVDVQKAIFGEKVFPNPKDHEVVAKLIRYVTEGDKEAIVLDSFAGSATTGH